MLNQADIKMSTAIGVNESILNFHYTQLRCNFLKLLMVGFVLPHFTDIKSMSSLSFHMVRSEISTFRG